MSRQRLLQILALTFATAAMVGCSADQSDRFGSNDDGGWSVDPDTSGSDTLEPPDPDSGHPDSSIDPDGGPSGDTGTCPDPADPDVEYISQSPEVCDSVRIGCQKGRVPFSNECGCGCHDVKPTCDAQDMRGDGNCRLSLGVKFNGTDCVSFSGCECVGSECNQRFSTLEACRAGYSECIGANCSGQDIRGEGACAALLGIKFTGDACVGVSGCECVGEDCADIYSTRSACQNAHQSCLNQSDACGAGEPACDRDEYCDYPNNTCGAADETGSCKESPRGCPGYYAPVCGCDGETYGNSCMAHAAGVDVASEGSCSE